MLGKYYLTSLLHEDDQRMIRLQCRLVGSWRHGLPDGYWKGTLFILPIYGKTILLSFFFIFTFRVHFTGTINKSYTSPLFRIDCFVQVESMDP